MSDRARLGNTPAAFGSLRPPLCFVSHGWADGGHAFAERLSDGLRVHGIDPWLDEERLAPGAQLEQTLRHAVLHRCDVFLALISPAWRVSRACRSELLCAIDRRRREGLQLVPVLWRPVDRIPSEIDDLCYLRLETPNDGDAMARLVSAIHRAAMTFHLLRRLREGARGQRYIAAQMLAATANRFTVPFLIDSVASDTEPLTRYWAAVALGTIGGEDACGALHRALRRECDPFVRQGIEDALTSGCSDESPIGDEDRDPAEPIGD